jgi:outer membrane autotransporter protein
MIQGTSGVAIDFTGASIPAYGTASQDGSLTFLPGSRVIGQILLGANDAVYFRPGDDISWLTTFTTDDPFTMTAIGDAPYVIDTAGKRFATLDPTAFGAADHALSDLTGGYTSLLDRRTADHGTSLWIDGFAGARLQGANGPALSSRDTFGGIGFGLDVAVSPDLLLGVMAGKGFGRVSVDSSSQTVDTDSWVGGLYGRKDFGSAFAGFTLLAGIMDNSSERWVANNLATDGMELARASYDGFFFSPQLSVGKDFVRADGSVWTPKASLRYDYGRFDGYAETGSDQDLTVGERTLGLLEGRIELTRSRTVALDADRKVTTSATAGLVFTTRVGDDTIAATLIGEDISFAAPGADQAIGVNIAAGIDCQLTKALSLTLKGEGTLTSDRSLSGQGSAGVALTF